MIENISMPVQNIPTLSVLDVTGIVIGVPKILLKTVLNKESEYRGYHDICIRSGGRDNFH